MQPLNVADGGGGAAGAEEGDQQDVRRDGDQRGVPAAVGQGPAHMCRPLPREGSGYRARSHGVHR